MIEDMAVLRKRFETLMHMAGHAAALLQWANQIELTGIALQNLSTEENDLMALGDELKAAAAAVRTNAEEVKAKIDSAVTRLSDNPTAEDITAALADLTVANETLGAAGGVADGIDPTVPTEGGVNEGDLPTE